MSSFSINAPLQIEELKSLRRQYSSSANFSFLGPKVPEATVDNPTMLTVTFPALAVVVSVTMPRDYPSSAPPLFKVDAVAAAGAVADDNSGALSPLHLECMEDLLKEAASYMPGLSCISTCLMSLDDLDVQALDLGTPGRYRVIIKVEVVNCSKFFNNAIKSAANGLPCKIYYKVISGAQLNNPKFSAAVDPWRGVYVLLDAPSKKEGVEFMKTVRTDGAMDWDMLGKPAKISLTVIEEFEIKAKGIGLEGFEGVDYNTEPDLEESMGVYRAKNAQVEINRTN
jgi:hypothetical protein